MNGYRVAVVGATGAVGSAMRHLLEKRRFPAAAVVPFASPRSAGRELDGMAVRPLTPESVNGFDLALFAAGSQISREWAPRFVAAGALVIDNSTCWRMDADVPLVVSEVNPHTLATVPKGIIANPNCVAMACLVALKPLHDAFDLRAVVATSFQAAGGAGQKGIDELEAQVEPLFARRELLRDDGVAAARLIEATPVHHNTLAFNVVPLLGKLDDAHGYTDEELKLVSESRKILQIPDLAMAPTCVRVPVMVSHAIQLRATFSAPVTAEAAIVVMERFPGLVLELAPTPLEWAGRDEVAVGRVRSDLHDPHSLNLFAVGDNLLKGAALNAVQIAELLHQHGTIRSRVGRSA